MDTKRFPKTTRLPAFRLDLANKMRDLPRYDTVIVGDDNAFSFALAEQNDLFKGISDRFPCRQQYLQGG